MRDQYDLIVIGSGMGGLTVASLMAALRGKRVLVLERHFKPGGYTHTFQRGRFHWDVGLHYVGDMAEGSSMRKVFDLVTAGRVRWSPMPDRYDRFIYPGLQFDLPTGKRRFIDALSERFPGERPAIRRYVRDMQRAVLGFQMKGMRNNGSAVARGIGWLAGSILRSDTQQTTGAYLEANFRDPKLRALLASQWGDYGLPPGRSPFPIHAMVAMHYMNGAWYPEGGSGTIADAVRDIVESRGGKFLMSREVTEILIRDGKAAGVRLSNGEEWTAPVVVSNAGAAVTYLKLLPASYPVPFRKSLKRFLDANPPSSALSLYIGFKRDPRELGFEGENYWIFSGFDHDRAFAERDEWIDEAKPRMAYLSFPSLKDPRAKSHTAEIITMASYARFAQWRNQPWLRRDVEYKALKERLSEGLIEFVDRHYPGFADFVEYRELSTPLTNESMTGHWKGALYGLPAVPERYRPKNRAWMSPRSPLPGLYLTGADTSSMGVVGALMGGVATLSWLPSGLSTPSVFREASRQKQPPRHAPPRALSAGYGA